MTKREELKHEVDLARIEIRNIKSDLTKLDKDLSDPTPISNGWAETWLKRVKDLRAAFSNLRK